MIASQNTVTEGVSSECKRADKQADALQTAIGTDAARSQYWTVMPAAVISRGSVTSHCNQ